MTLKVTTFSSKGRATRIYSNKTKRIHHLQSDIQLNIFLILEWIDSVEDIVENYELIDLMEHLNNIENLRIDKFFDNKRSETYKMHTNFLISVRTNDSGLKFVALSTKSKSELERRTVIKKMEIERRYWTDKNVEFYVLTDGEINKTLVKNIRWVRETLIDEAIRDKEELSLSLYKLLMKNKLETISYVLEKNDYIEELREGTSLFLFRYLIGNKKIRINMMEEINLNRKVGEIII